MGCFGMLFVLVCVWIDCFDAFCVISFWFGLFLVAIYFCVFLLMLFLGFRG